jgi:hypothetical protein
MKADMERLKTGQAPAPRASTAPAIPKPAAPAEQQEGKALADQGISIPESPGGKGKRKLILGVVAIIVVLLLGYAIVSMLGGDPEPVATRTPEQTATPTATLKPSVRSLASYFGQASGTLNAMDLTDDLGWLNQLRDLPGPPKDARSVNLIGPDDTDPIGSVLSMPSAVRTSLGEDSIVLVFGQDELFDDDGAQQEVESPEQRLIFVIEVTDASSANQAMQAWEQSSLEEDVAFALVVTPNLAIVETFSDAAYRQIPLRYRNYPYADTSIDWGIVSASNGANYLVISGSRQSIFFAIDQLLK